MASRWAGCSVASSETVRIRAGLGRDQAPDLPKGAQVTKESRWVQFATHWIQRHMQGMGIFSGPLQEVEEEGKWGEEMGMLAGSIL